MTGKSHKKGLETIAIFEATKGLLVLAAGFGILELIGHDLQKIGEQLLVHFGMNVHHRYSKILLQLLAGVTRRDIILFAIGAVAYSTLRFVEAYGLWTQKKWGQWLAIISGGLYLPLEFRALYHHFTTIKAWIALINILIVVYLIWVRFSERTPEPEKS